MASVNVWGDFETIRHGIKHNTVDRLKQILTGFNEECGSNLTKQGKKQELIDRVIREMDNWRRNNSTTSWTKAKAVLNQVKASGSFSHSRVNGDSSYIPGMHTQTFSASTSAAQPYPTASGSSTIPRYDPYAPARRPTVPPPAPTTSSAPSPAIRFKTSPFFRVERAITTVVECPESTSPMDRRQQSVNFTVNNDMLMKLKTPSPKYQLRLYCTSSIYYSPSSAFRPSAGPCPIEFPPTCEVRVNSVTLSANLKGMKKKPGTAPPPDLGKSLRLMNGASNKVEMVYVNSQQPVQSKKYYLVVMLVEVTSVEQLIDRLKKGKYKSSDEILAKMLQVSQQDDEIVAGHQKMSLKCPLSYMRISTPCRSIQCVHSQCFDAMSWFSVMEQTTTWLCPVCEKVLNPEDLIVDGYFDEILKNTHEDVEDVIVEADGQWHTSDNKYGSAKWKAAHASVKPPIPVKSASPPKRRSISPAKHVLNGKQKAYPSTAEIVILDSDDEDEGRVKRELSPSSEPMISANSSFNSGIMPPRSQTQESDVIDLTLDSDDEDPPAMPLSKKRKTMEGDIPSPTEQIWKKSRAEGMSSPGSSSASVYGGARVPAQQNHVSRPPTIPSFSPAGYTPFNSRTSAYPGYPPVAPPAATSRRPSDFGGQPPYLAAMGAPFLPRVNGAAGGSSSPEAWRS